MGRLLTWQWTRRRSLTPSTKRVSHRGSLLKGVTVHRVLYQSILNAKLTGRKKLAENVHKQQGVVQASQGVNWSWSQCIKSHHAPTSSWKGLLSHFWNRNNVRSMLSGLRRKITGLLLSGPKSSFQIKVNFPFHLEIKVWRKSGEAQYPSCLKFSVKFPQSVMIWGAVTSAGVGPLCFIKSKVNVAIYHEISEHFMLPSAGKLYRDADFLFQQDFSTCPQGQTHFQVVCWPWIYWSAWLASQHAWPVLNPIWNKGSMGYFHEKDETQSIQQYRRAEGSMVPQQCHRLIASMPHLTDAGVCAKVTPSIECINEHTLKNLNFSVLLKKNWVYLRKYSNILDFWLSWAAHSNHQN